MSRKSYTKEFKLDAIALVVEQGYKVPEAARSLDINANCSDDGSKSSRVRKNGRFAEMES